MTAGVTGLEVGVTVEVEGGEGEEGRGEVSVVEEEDDAQGGNLDVGCKGLVKVPRCWCRDREHGPARGWEDGCVGREVRGVVRAMTSRGEGREGRLNQRTRRDTVVAEIWICTSPLCRLCISLIGVS